MSTTNIATVIGGNINPAAAFSADADTPDVKNQIERRAVPNINDVPITNNDGSPIIPTVRSGGIEITQLWNGNMRPVRRGWMISVSPYPYHTTLLHGSLTMGGRGITQYILAGNRLRNSFSATEVVTSVANIPRMVDMDHSSHREIICEEIDIESIGNSLMVQWNDPSSGRAGGSGVGFWNNPNIPGPDDGESKWPIDFLNFVQGLRNQLSARFAQLLTTANGRHAKGQEVTDNDRIAAFWMYGDQASQRFPWYEKKLQGQLKLCPACRQSIDADSLTCSQCSRDLVVFYAERGFRGPDIQSIDYTVSQELDQYIARKKMQDDEERKARVAETAAIVAEIMRQSSAPSASSQAQQPKSK